MVAVLGDQIVGISLVLLRQLLHHSPHLRRSHLRPSDQYRLPEREPIALPRLPFENPRRRILVRPERVLHSMNLNAGMVDAEAQPVGVAINGGEIVDIKVNRH